jgi:hypothetical protein
MRIPIIVHPAGAVSTYSFRPKFWDSAQFWLPDLTTAPVRFQNANPPHFS